MKKLCAFFLVLAVAFLASCPDGTNKTNTKTVIAIMVENVPIKTEYNVDEPFETTGLIVTAAYSDGTTAPVTGYTLAGFDNSTEGEQTITVTYQGKTATFIVIVIDPFLTVARPVARPSAGPVDAGTEVTLDTTTEGAEIWYTTNGNTPRKGGSTSTRYDAATPIVINAAVTIRAIAVKDEMKDSSILSSAYTIALNWVWELADDKNQTKFAAGISELYGYTEDPDKYSQSFVLNEPYVSGEPSTGWYKKRMIQYTRPNGSQGTVEAVEMQDAHGFAPDLYWPNNKEQGDLIPMKVPTKATTMGPYGVEVDAFHFWGTLMQKGSESEDSTQWVTRTGVTNPKTELLGPASSANDYRWGCGWPAITLYATPPDVDEDPQQKTRFALMDGYGYTFWVKADKDYRSYRSLVENWEYRPNEGHDPGHWYGPSPGRDGTPGKNYTPAAVGQWRQVRVIYDSQHPQFNLSVPNWTTSYDIQSNYPGDREPATIVQTHDKDHSIRISFSFMLQFNGGNEGTNRVEYSVDTGRHEFDVWIYGLEILKYE